MVELVGAGFKQLTTLYKNMVNCVIIGLLLDVLRNEPFETF